MLKNIRLDISHFALLLATRNCIVSQHKLIPYAAILRQNGVRIATLDSKNSVILPFSFRCYSSNRRDIKLPSDNTFEQIIPTSESMQSLKLSNSTRDVSINEESNKSSFQEIRDAELLELYKHRDDKSLEHQNIQTTKQNEKDALENLLLHKNLTALIQLLVPSFCNSLYTLCVQDEYNKMKNDPSYTIDLNYFEQNIKNISASWKPMTEPEMLEHEQKYKLLKEQYTIELYKWWDNVDKNLVKLENCRRRSINKNQKNLDNYKLPMLVDPRAPKRPITAYAMFTEYLKESNDPELPSGYIDCIKYTATKWNKLPKIEKDVYINKFKAAFKHYKKVSKKYK
ncbi:hypothetical protein BB561_004075 [Smittium simulii]|uniref:HMG box domain-containing protein n=1 Tax=Smittium simulii TaxID=133385 RepID=A0A2T9YI68_9FUNG|nr:hypothetical protein BB561_004075 [Smittium simulii]